MNEYLRVIHSDHLFSEYKKRWHNLFLQIFSLKNPKKVVGKIDEKENIYLDSLKYYH